MFHNKNNRIIAIKKNGTKPVAKPVAKNRCISLHFLLSVFFRIFNQFIKNNVIRYTRNYMNISQYSPVGITTLSHNPLRHKML